MRRKGIWGVLSGLGFTTSAVGAVLAFSGQVATTTRVASPPARHRHAHHAAKRHRAQVVVRRSTPQRPTVVVEPVAGTSPHPTSSPSRNPTKPTKPAPTHSPAPTSPPTPAPTKTPLSACLVIVCVSAQQGGAAQ